MMEGEALLGDTQTRGIPLVEVTSRCKSGYCERNFMPQQHKFPCFIFLFDFQIDVKHHFPICLEIVQR